MINYHNEKFEEIFFSSLSYNVIADTESLTSKTSHMFVKVPRASSNS